MNNPFCEEGCGGFATIFCECKNRKEFLCDACFPAHRKKTPTLVHRTMGVEVTTPSDVYQKRCSDFTTRKAELIGVMTKVDQCSAEFERVVDDVVRTIQTYCEEQMAQLEQWKTQFAYHIELCIQEVEATLDQEEPDLSGVYSSYLRGNQPDCPLYFDYRIETTPIYACMQHFLNMSWLKQASPSVSNVRKCSVCPNPISNWTISLPADLEHLRPICKDFCSLKCLRYMSLLGSNDKSIKCVGCSQQIEVNALAGPTVMSLKCGHPFHDKPCLEKSLWEGLECPVCKFKCEESDAEAIFGNAAMVSLQASRCSRCGLHKASKTYGFCHHQLCSKCDNRSFFRIWDTSCQQCKDSSATPQ